MKSLSIIFNFTALGIFSICLLLLTSCGPSEDGKNGFERTIEGINRAGKSASGGVKKVDSTLEKVSKTATEVSDHLEKYKADSVKK